MGRTELRVATARSDWPFDPKLPDVAVNVPGTMPSNVENGVGYVGGVATWSVPFTRCKVLAARPGQQQSCSISYNARSASITGRVTRSQCGEPHALADVRLIETFADGGSVRLSWRTDWKGRFRFEGIEPGADLVVDLGSASPPVPLPRLGPGQRYDVGELTVPVDC